MVSILAKNNVMRLLLLQNGILFAALSLVMSCRKTTTIDESNGRTVKPTATTVEMANRIQRAIEKDTRELQMRLEKHQHRLITNSAFRNEFFTESLNQHCATLLSLDPVNVINDGFVWQAPSLPAAFLEPDVIVGNPALINTPETEHVQALDLRIKHIEALPVNNEADLNSCITQIQTAINDEIHSVNADHRLDVASKQQIVDALFATRETLPAEVNYLRNLMSVSDPDYGNNIIEHQRKRNFLGRLIRGIARVAIGIVAVAVVTAVVVKTGGLLAPKFALAVKKSGGLLNSVMNGVTLTKKGITTYGAWKIGSVYGAINAASKWDKEMSMDKWYDEFKIVIKPKTP